MEEENKKGGENRVFTSRGGGVVRQTLYDSANQPCQAGPLFHLRETSRNVVRNLPPEGVVQFF
jgi:hypothetical protein